MSLRSLCLSLFLFAACSQAAGPDEQPDTAEPDPEEMGEMRDARVPMDASARVDAGLADAARETPVDARVPDARVDSGGVLDASVRDATVGDARVEDDHGEGDGKDVVTLGDSWMSNTLQLEGTGGGIAPSLRAVSKQPYPNYAVQGVMMLSTSLFGPAIPTQWTAASRANAKIRTVVMTGGGNDIIQNPTLQTDCMNGGAMCDAKLEEIVVALRDLWAKMAAAGVEDIIHVMYSSDAGSALKDPSKNAMRLKEACAAVALPTRCHLVATNDLVMGALALDGIHPTQPANDRMAKAIYTLMEQEGIRR